MPPADSAPAAPAGHSGSGTMTLTRVSVPTTGCWPEGWPQLPGTRRTADIVRSVTGRGEPSLPMRSIA